MVNDMFIDSQIHDLNVSSIYTFSDSIALVTPSGGFIIIDRDLYILSSIFDTIKGVLVGIKDSICECFSFNGSSYDDLLRENDLIRQRDRLVNPRKNSFDRITADD